jgi:hypothetical protein
MESRHAGHRTDAEISAAVRWDELGKIPPVWGNQRHHLFPRLALASQFFEGQSLVQPDCQRELYLVSAGFGDVEFRLPAPSSAAGRRFTIKKSDPYSPVVRVTQTGGGGPDSEVITLAGHGHALTVMSDGGRWLILSRYQ